MSLWSAVVSPASSRRMLLQKAGLSVALLERERLAARDSGTYTTAHLTYVTDSYELYELVKDFGRDHARSHLGRRRGCHR